MFVNYPAISKYWRSYSTYSTGALVPFKVHSLGLIVGRVHLLCCVLLNFVYGLKSSPPN